MKFFTILLGYFACSISMATGATISLREKPKAGTSWQCSASLSCVGTSSHQKDPTDGRELFTVGVTSYLDEAAWTAAATDGLPPWFVPFNGDTAGIQFRVDDENFEDPEGNVRFSLGLSIARPDKGFNEIINVFGSDQIASLLIDKNGGTQHTVAITFENSVLAWGADFTEINQDLTFELFFEGMPGDDAETYLLEVGSQFDGFLGFVSDNFPITSVVMDKAMAGGSDEAYRMDNVRGRDQDAPSAMPTATPSSAPSETPSGSPSSAPSMSPSSSPSESVQPSSAPSVTPSLLPSSSPSRSPSGAPSSEPSKSPSSESECFGVDIPIIGILFKILCWLFG